MQNIQLEDALRDIWAVAFTLGAFSGSNDLTTEDSECLQLLRRILVSAVEKIEHLQNTYNQD